MKFRHLQSIASAAAIFAASSLSAATASYDANHAQDTLLNSEKPSLQDLIREDALGSECINENDIDRAFFASGKGLRLPRTCLPEPCDQALTPFRLAELIGRPAQQNEWDRYFSRYADVCRKEVVGFDDDTAAPMSPEEFWTPVLGASNVGRTLGQTTVTNAALLGLGNDSRFGSFILGGFGGGGGLGGSGGSGGSSTETIFDGEDSGTGSTGEGGDGGSGQLVETPLPAGIWLLLSAMLFFFTARRSRA